MMVPRQIGSDGVGGVAVAGVGSHPGTAAGGEQCGRIRVEARWAFGEPGGQGFAELAVHGHCAGLLALADEVQLALAGGQLDVGDVQGGDLGDTGSAEQR